MKKISFYIFFWAPVVVWMLLMFTFSSKPTGMVSVVHWQDVIVKKTAHLTEYFILTILAYRALLNSGVPKKKAAKYALTIAILFACTDEFHQRFTFGRESTLRDVIIDTIGASGAFYTIWKLLPKLQGKPKMWAESLDLR